MKKETEVERLNRLLNAPWSTQEVDEASLEVGFNAGEQARRRLLRMKKEDLVTEFLKQDKKTKQLGDKIKQLNMLMSTTESPADGDMKKKEQVVARVQLMLVWLRKKKWDPLNLPAVKNGAKSVKADLRKAMEKQPLFSAETAFAYAWRKATSSKNPVIRFGRSGE